MTAHLLTRTAGPKRAGRVGTLFGYDGRIAATLLRIFQFFLVSVSFFACLAPALAFTLLVGWQLTHFAVWLGAASLLPLAPAVVALLAAAERGLLLRTNEVSAAREFWCSFAGAACTLWWVALATSAAVVFLAYDLALMGQSDLGFLGVVAVAAFLWMLLLGIGVVATRSPHLSPLALLAAAGRVILTRPHLALSWLLLTGLGLGLAAVPLVGFSAALFAPALVAIAIAICNNAMGLSATLSKETRS
jgi:hypothetical protein